MPRPVKPPPNLPFFPILPVAVFAAISLSSCMSQREIEIACRQTLSASTPVCYCDQQTSSPPAGETPVPPAAQIDGNISAPNLTPLPPRPPIDGALIFSEGFESGSLSGFRSARSDYFGKGVFYRHDVVNSPALGRYAAGLTIGSGNTTAAYLFMYTIPIRQPGVYSVDLFVPSSIMPGDWWNIWQWKSEDNAYDKPLVSLDLVRKGSRLISRMYHTPGGSSQNASQEISLSDPVTFPTDQWVNLTGVYFATPDNTGYAEIYQDGVKIFEIRDIQTRPGDRDIFWSVNSYADTIAPDPATIYVDNIAIYEALK